jgi:cell shape-determining protein MreC
VTSVHKDPTLPYAVVSAIPTALLEQAREVLLVWHEQLPDQSSPTVEDNAKVTPP